MIYDLKTHVDLVAGVKSIPVNGPRTDERKEEYDFPTCLDGTALRELIIANVLLFLLFGEVLISE